MQDEEQDEEARAIAAYERLCALDSTRSERQELLGAGIGRSTVESLYPSTFDSLAAPVAAYLLQHGRTLRWVSVPALVEQRRKTEGFIWALSEELFDDWTRTSPVTKQNWNDPAWRPLEDAINEIHTSEQAAVPTLSIIWGAWWLMKNRDQLEPAAYSRTIGCMCWVIDHILPSLAKEA